MSWMTMDVHIIIFFPMDVHIISNKLILRRFSSQLHEDCMWRYNRAGLQFFWCSRRMLKCVFLNTQTYIKEIFKNGQNPIEVGGLDPHASIILLDALCLVFRHYWYKFNLNNQITYNIIGTKLTQHHRRNTCASPTTCKKVDNRRQTLVPVGHQPKALQRLS